MSKYVALRVPHAPEGNSAGISWKRGGRCRWATSLGGGSLAFGVALALGATPGRASAQVRFPTDKGWSSAPTKMERKLCLGLARQLKSLPASLPRNDWPDQASAPHFWQPKWTAISLSGHEDLIVTALARKSARVRYPEIALTAEELASARSLYRGLSRRGVLRLFEAKIGTATHSTHLYRVEVPGFSIGTLQALQRDAQKVERTSLLIIGNTWQLPSLRNWPIYPAIRQNQGIIWRNDRFWMLDPSHLSVRKIILNSNNSVIGNDFVCALKGE